MKRIVRLMVTVALIGGAALPNAALAQNLPQIDGYSVVAFPQSYREVLGRFGERRVYHHQWQTTIDEEGLVIWHAGAGYYAYTESDIHHRALDTSDVDTQSVRIENLDAAAGLRLQSFSDTGRVVMLDFEADALSYFDLTDPERLVPLTAIGQSTRDASINDVGEIVYASQQDIRSYDIDEPSVVPRLLLADPSDGDGIGLPLLNRRGDLVFGSDIGYGDAPWGAESLWYLDTNDSDASAVRLTDGYVNWFTLSDNGNLVWEDDAMWGDSVVEIRYTNLRDATLEIRDFRFPTTSGEIRPVANDSGEIVWVGGVEESSYGLWYLDTRDANAEPVRLASGSRIGSYPSHAAINNGGQIAWHDEGVLYVATPDSAGAGPGVTCGTPTIDAAVDRGLFTWQDCADGSIQVLGAGGDASARYSGAIASATQLTAPDIGKMEIGDRATLAPSGRRIDFSIALGGRWYDDFSFFASSPTCMVVNARSADTALGVGSAKTSINGSFDPATGEACELPETEDVVCGAPSLDRESATGLYVWQNCSGSWSVLLTGTNEGGGSVSVAGNVDSAAAFSTLREDSIESRDTVILESSDRASFDLETQSPWDDTFSFTLDSDRAVCLRVEQLTQNLVIRRGRDQVPVTASSFDPATGEGCSTP